MSTRGQLRGLVRSNLADANITFYSDDEINQSLQDGYNEVAFSTLCIVKSITLNWPNATTYYDFLNDFGVADFLCVIGVFNNATNQWLRDDVSLRDFDRLRRDWETWVGAPQFWAPHSLQRVAIAPHYVVANGQFTLWYWAQAPVLADDNTVPIIAQDMHSLLEYYATADMLETAEEITKAAAPFAMWETNLVDYKQRCHNLAKSDVLLRI